MSSGAFEGSDRRERLPSNWIGLVSAIRKRSGGRCEVKEPIKDGGFLQRCWRPMHAADHIVAGDDHSMKNLQAICRYHHGKKTAQEGVAARKRPSAAREAERHPGSR